ncbi:MAG: type II toxin-antitoxin system Phd/YefM family antitoxin [Candidatus Binatia bacterium]
MTSVSIEEAQSRLPELIAKTAPGEEVLITRDNKPVAQLVRLPVGKPQPVFGSCKGKLRVVAEDDEHLRDFAEYME